MYSNKWVSLVAVSAIMMFESSCQDWGQQDPLAGNQTYPTLQTVSTFDFEDGLDPVLFRSTASSAGVDPVVIEDETVQSQVLSLDGGYVSFTNPLTAVSVQTAVSYTFWYKQNVAYETDADGNATETALGLDTEGAIFGWKNQNSTASAFITPNLWISYTGLDGEWEDNNPSEYATGYITPGEWHYVAIIIREDGYGVYVDGDKKTDKVVTDFDMSKLVQFMAQAPTMTIGSGNDVEPRAFEIDDLTFYRNEITSKQIASPKKGSIGGSSSTGGDSVDLSKWIMVGAEDNTAGFWTVWSDYVNLTGNGTIHYEFYNYGGPSNWNYWGLVITNGLARDAEGYTEYLFLRCDNYGWASLYDNTTLECDYNWDTYGTEMDGAYVVMDITRKGDTVTTSSVITCTSGNTYHYKSTTTGFENETIGTFFTCDGSHYLFNPDATFVGQVYESGSNVTGNTDCSSTWWTAFSDLYTFDSSFTKWGVEFINGNAGNGGNWNNWLLVTTNGKAYGEDGYSEYYVLRSDAYGWGSLYDSSTMTQSFDWTTYVEDMHNATCRLYFDYTNSKLTMVARQTKEDGTAFPEYRFETPGMTAPIGIFFTAELAYIDFLKVGYFPWVDMDPQE